jgi:hypothetical protein
MIMKMGDKKSGFWILDFGFILIPQSLAQTWLIRLTDCFKLFAPGQSAIQNPKSIIQNKLIPQSAIRNPKSIIFLLCVLVTATACAHKRLTYPPLPKLTDPEKYLQEVLRTAENHTHVSGLAKLKFSSLNRKLSTRNIFIVKRPYFIRLEVLGFFNLPSFYFVTDGNKINLFVPSKNSFYVGNATEENLSAILPIKLETKDIVQFLLGFPPVINNIEGSKISWMQDEKYYFFDISDTNTNQYLWIDPVHNRITKYILFEMGELKSEFLFSDFKSVGGYLFPSKIELNYHRYQTNITVDYESQNTNSVSMEMFRLTPPPQVKYLPYKDFINGN